MLCVCIVSIQTAELQVVWVHLMHEFVEFPVLHVWIGGKARCGAILAIRQLCDPTDLIKAEIGEATIEVHAAPDILHTSVWTLWWLGLLLGSSRFKILARAFIRAAAGERRLGQVLAQIIAHRIMSAGRAKLNIHGCWRLWRRCDFGPLFIDHLPMLLRR